jgi:circadian clock protein KaiB
MTPERGGVPRTGVDALYHLRLFVSGASDLSARAIDDITLLCDEHLDAAYRLTVVDIHDDPAAALSRRVHVAPTLVRLQPLPVRRIVGDLSDSDRVLAMLLVADAETSRSPGR